MPISTSFYLALCLSSLYLCAFLCTFLSFSLLPSTTLHLSSCPPASLLPTDIIYVFLIPLILSLFLPIYLLFSASLFFFISSLFLSPPSLFSSSFFSSHFLYLFLSPPLYTSLSVSLFLSLAILYCFFHSDRSCKHTHTSTTSFYCGNKSLDCPTACFSIIIQE